MNSRVSIIILNWNGWEDTIECLESLNQICYDNYDVVLIDNGSSNDSIEKIREYCNGDIIVESNFFSHDSSNKPIKIIEYNKEELDELNKIENDLDQWGNDKKVIIIKNRKNYGFTKGNNIGIKFAITFLDPEYILLLNNDTVVNRDFLKILVNYGNNHKKAGFLGPKIYFYEFEGKKNIIQCAGANQSLWFYHPTINGIFEMDRGQYDKLAKVDFVQGACILAKIEMIKDIGYLDEDFFSYREENDWGIRGHDHDWESLYVPSSIIWHKGGKSSGGQLSPFTIFYITKNDFLLIKKHGNLLQILFFYLFFIFFKLWFFSGVYLIYHRNFESFIAFIKGFIEGITWKKIM